MRISETRCGDGLFWILHGPIAGEGGRDDRAAVRPALWGRRSAALLQIQRVPAVDLAGLGALPMPIWHCAGPVALFKLAGITKRMTI